MILCAALVAAASLGAAPGPALADARTDYLVRILGTSSTFRVRAQAALSLARVEPSPEVVEALMAALRDENAAVRAAAASSLERLGDPRALPALEAAQEDRDRDVRHAARRAARALEREARQQRARERRALPEAKYYVGVGLPATRLESLGPDDLQAAREYIRGKVEAMDGVVLAPDGETPAAAEAAIGRRGLIGFYLETSIVRVEPVEGGTRAQVSLLVNTYPGRNMRAMLQGAATVQGAATGSAVAQRQAIQGALSGALRRVPEALEQSAARRGG